jgi:hypothetical protein
LLFSFPLSGFLDFFVTSTILRHTIKLTAWKLVSTSAQHCFERVGFKFDNCVTKLRNNNDNDLEKSVTEMSQQLHHFAKNGAYPRNQRIICYKCVKAAGRPRSPKAHAARFSRNRRGADTDLIRRKGGLQMRGLQMKARR